MSLASYQAAPPRVSILIDFVFLSTANSDIFLGFEAAKSLANKKTAQGNERLFLFGSPNEI